MISLSVPHSNCNEWEYVKECSDTEWISSGAVLAGNAIIGAGSVIIKDVPDGVTIVGNPGEIIKS